MKWFKWEETCLLFLDSFEWKKEKRRWRRRSCLESSFILFCCLSSHVWSDATQSSFIEGLLWRNAFFSRIHWKGSLLLVWLPFLGFFFLGFLSMCPAFFGASLPFLRFCSCLSIDAQCEEEKRHSSWCPFLDLHCHHRWVFFLLVCHFRDGTQRTIFFLLLFSLSFHSLSILPNATEIQVQISCSIQFLWRKNQSVKKN